MVSPASYWEIAIKISIDYLHIHPKHTAVVAVLPFHHKDPFDRLLVAQAMVERVPIISDDATLDAYGITRLW